MPIQSCTLPGGGKGYKWGSSGHCYASRQDALKQMRAIFHSGYKGEGAEVLAYYVDAAKKSTVQTISFAKAKFSKEDAIQWAKDLGYKADVVETDDSFRFIQSALGEYKNYDTVEIDDGIEVLAGSNDDKLYIGKQLELALQDHTLANSIMRAEAKPISTVQCLIIDKSIYSREDAVKWAIKHSFKSNITDESGFGYRLQQFPEGKFKSLRTITLNNGIKAVLGYNVLERLGLNGPTNERMPYTRDGQNPPSPDSVIS